MAFALYILLILAMLVTLPPIVFAARRLMLAYRLTTACRRKGVRFTPLKAFWWLDTIRSGACACVIETADTCYVLKLIGTVSRRQHIRFFDETHYAIRSLRFETHTTAKAATYVYKQKEPYRFAECITDKAIYPVLLLHPAPTTISVRRAHSTHEQAATPYWVTPKTDAPAQDELLQNGDFTGEGYVYTEKAFMKLL